MKMRCLLILFSLLVFSLFSCSKKDVAADGSQRNETPPEQPDATDLNPVEVHRALFINPAWVKMKKRDPAIVNAAEDYLNNTPKGAKAYLSIYLFNYKPLMEAVRNAQQRGVEVHLMIDSGREESWKTNKKSYSYFRSLLNKEQSTFYTVKNDNSSTAINHEKYMAISEVHLQNGIARNLVFATSHNFIEAATKKVQDAVVMTNKALYNAFVANWKAVASRAEGGMKDFTYTENGIGDSISACFFPRRKGGVFMGGDRVVEELDKLNGSYTTDTVRLVMAFFSGRVAIADKLIDIQKNKIAQVQVITRKSGQGSSTAIINRLKKLKDYGGDVKVVDISKEQIHSKCMLIKGRMDGVPQKKILTGSHNYTQGALEYNNEFLLVLAHSSFFGAYWNYYTNVQNTFSGIAASQW